jgi:hypothetical protein
MNKNGVPLIMEHKSTSGDVSSGSDFWKGLAMDTQSMLYIYVARRLQKAGQLAKLGLKASDPLISGVFYDAWHKPQIKIKKLSKSDTNKFRKEQTYFDVEFEVKECENGLTVDGAPAVCETTKDDKLVVYETPDMYGARLIADEYENPAKYFGRRELSFTDPQMEAYELELAGIYMDISYYRKMGTWWHDETACEEKFKCDYIGTCYNGLDILKHIPAGYKGPREEYKIIAMANLYVYDVDHDLSCHANVQEFVGENTFKRAMEYRDDLYRRYPTVVAIIQANVLSETEHCDELMDELEIPKEFDEEGEEDGYAS